jgi:hypothetical protein
MRRHPRDPRRWFARRGVSIVGVIVLAVFVGVLAAAVVYIYLKARSGTV